MTISVETFRNEFTEGALNFVWRQWCQMGVAGSVKRRDQWVIDPEPLLAFTTEVARYDARMFDETLDWLVTNGHWINAQRFSTVMKQDNVGDRAVAGAIASWMAERDKSMKWRGLAQRMAADARKPDEPLFRTPTGKALASSDQMDAHFHRYGFLRKNARARGMTQPVNMKDPVNIMFKSRALFGIGIRADVMVYLMITEGAYPREVARTLGYNHMRVQELLVDLADANVVSVRSVGRTKQYRIDRDKWRSVLMGEQPFMPRWINWRALTRGLTAIWRTTWGIEKARADDYIFSSKMRSAMQAARNDLLGSGMDFVIEDDRGHIAEAYLPIFMRDARNILKVLAGFNKQS